MSALRGSVSLCLFLCLGSCAAYSPKDVANPTKLTVEDAMTDIGRGFAGLKAELRKSDLKLGIFPCKVTVNLNVTASADQGGKLVIDASTAPTTTATTSLTNTISASGHFEQTNSSAATRGNTVVVEMYNVACVPKDTLAGSFPDKVEKVSKVVQESPTSTPFFHKTGG
ncbi:hypothetical protein [Rhizobium chutanense]|nr:hypothetical protein [Rhizobium chutanense]